MPQLSQTDGGAKHAHGHPGTHGAYGGRQGQRRELPSSARREEAVVAEWQGQEPGDPAPPLPQPEGPPLEPTPTTPTAPRRHTATTRGLDLVPASRVREARFGRMFRNLPVFEHREESLKMLAQKMVAPAKPEVPEGEPDPDENEDIPSGYTYLGQFIDHDITFDPASSLQRQNDPDALQNFRTPRLDLDSLYGRGPSDQPYLYRHDRVPVSHPTIPDVDLRGTIFLQGHEVDDDPQFAGPDLPRNLPRERLDGRALIGDPRNDENLVVSQLHATFLRFHNRVVEEVAASGPYRGQELFKEAQRIVRWHYQWVVLHDFLRRVVGEEVMKDLLPQTEYEVGGGRGKASIRRARLHFYRPQTEPFMPIEFSVAAYRFGHSMVRPSYFFNDFVKEATGNQRTPIFSASTGELDNLNGFRRLPDKWGFQWKFFFEVDPGHAPQPSYNIDAQLANPLGDLPSEPDPTSLAERNLLRSLRLRLPSGASVAGAMGLEPLDADQLGSAEMPDDVREHPPLWFYVLKEAEVLGGKKQLGPIGGRIVAEVLVGLLAGDPLSYLRVEPNWKPSLPTRHNTSERFDMADLIRFAVPEQVPSS